MKLQEKSIYKAPVVKLVEIKTQAIICTSGDTERYGVNSNSYNDSDFE